MKVSCTQYATPTPSLSIVISNPATLYVQHSIWTMTCKQQGNHFHFMILGKSLNNRQQNTKESCGWRHCTREYILCFSYTDATLIQTLLPFPKVFGLVWPHCIALQYHI